MTSVHLATEAANNELPDLVKEFSSPIKARNMLSS